MSERVSDEPLCEMASGSVRGAQQAYLFGVALALDLVDARARLREAEKLLRELVWDDPDDGVCIGHTFCAFGTTEEDTGSVTLDHCDLCERVRAFLSGTDARSR